MQRTGPSTIQVTFGASSPSGVRSEFAVTVVCDQEVELERGSSRAYVRACITGAPC